MVFVNMKYFKTLPILGKLFTIIFGIVSIGIGGHAYEKSLYNMIWKLEKATSQPLYINMSNSADLQSETFFVIVVTILLLYSVLSLQSNILNAEFSQTKCYKQIDIAVHVAGAVLQIVAGSLMIVSSNKIANDCKQFRGFLKYADMTCQYEGEKICAGVFAILNSFVYGFVACMGVRHYNLKKGDQGNTSGQAAPKL